MSTKKNEGIAWPMVYRGGGNLDTDLINEMRSLLNDFGMLLGIKAMKDGINKFAFPLFREFNLIGALTNNQVLYALSPSIGLPTLSWIDWQKKDSEPKEFDLANSVRIELGWKQIFTISFPRSILDHNSKQRESVLQEKTNEWIHGFLRDIERQARMVKLNPIFKGRDFLIEEDLCFVLMPFKEPFFRLFKDQIKPTLEDLGLRVAKSDDFFTNREIIEDIWECINKARVIIADVTGRNGNVFYELGLAHAVGKPVIILTQDANDVPFDIKHIRFFKYSDNEKGWQKLRIDLKNAIIESLQLKRLI